MVVHRLLLRGMLSGLIAGLLAFGFARLAGEPSVDRAIAFESAEAKAKGEPPEPALVSRAMQRNVGLPAGQMLYGGALGGLFALLFAIAQGRYTRLPARQSAALLASLCFVTVFLVPFVKYPANPPAVGEPGTIGLRTALFAAMIILSIIAMMAAFSLKRWIEPSIGGWNAGLVGALAFLVLVGIGGYLMPPIDEVPAAFPAATLWQFRIAAVGIQALLWSVIGVVFGGLTERSLQR